MPITTAKIVGFLRKQGNAEFPLAYKIPSRIRGLDQRSTGYQVSKGFRADRPVRIEYNMRSPNRELEISRLRKLEDALTAAGYKVEGAYPGPGDLGIACLTIIEPEIV